MSRQRIRKLVGILESGEIIYIDELHDNGVSTVCFTYHTQQTIDDRNDIENVKFSYDYLWKEAVHDGLTELGLDDYLQECVDQLNTTDRYFFGHDTSYTDYVTDEDRQLIEEYYDEAEIECFECIGGDNGYLHELRFQKIFNQELLNRALEYDRNTNAPRQPQPPQLRLV